MSAKVELSRFSSLLFNRDFKTDFEIDVCDVQEFAKSDTIRVQYTLNIEGTLPAEKYIPVVYLREGIDGNRILVPTSAIYVDEVLQVFEFTLSGLEFGCYRVEIAQNIDSKYRVLFYSDFNVLPLSELKQTSLIRYSHWRNEYDTIFRTDSETKYFDYRVIGGFLSNEITLSVDNESFRDQRYGLHQLSQYPYYTETFTVGDAIGVNRWVGEKINLIFALTDIFINGKGYVRSESSTPELISLGDYRPLFSFKIDLEPTDSFYSTNIVLPLEPVRLHSQPPFSNTFN